MNKLYENRERSGDVVFVFRNGGGEPNIDIPVPSHALASDKAADDAEMKDEQTVRIRCHKQVLISQSAYFTGLMEFNEARHSQLAEIVLDVHDYSQEVFEAMIRFLYLGETKLNSNNLVDLLNLCQEYLLPAMKQAIEHVFAD